MLCFWHLGLVSSLKHHQWCLGIELSMLIVGLGAIGACRGSPSPIHWCPNTANSVLARYEPVVFLLPILTGTDPLLYLGVCLQGQSVSLHWCPNTASRALVGSEPGALFLQNFALHWSSPLLRNVFTGWAHILPLPFYFYFYLFLFLICFNSFATNGLCGGLPCDEGPHCKGDHPKE